MALGGGGTECSGRRDFHVHVWFLLPRNTAGCVCRRQMAKWCNTCSSHSRFARYCIEFCQKLGDTQAEIIRKIQQAFGDDATRVTQIKEWFNRFKNGCTSADSDQRSGSLSTSRNAVIDKVRTLIMRAVVWLSGKLLIGLESAEVPQTRFNWGAVGCTQLAAASWQRPSSFITPHPGFPGAWQPEWWSQRKRPLLGNGFLRHVCTATNTLAYINALPIYWHNLLSNDSVKLTLTSTEIQQRIPWIWGILGSSGVSATMDTWNNRGTLRLGVLFQVRVIPAKAKIRTQSQSSRDRIRRTTDSSRFILLPSR
jgi:hypothetical protein